MNPQEWRELNVGNKVAYRGKTLIVVRTTLDEDHDQKGVTFCEEGSVVETTRIPGTYAIMPFDFVDGARVVKERRKKKK